MFVKFGEWMRKNNPSISWFFIGWCTAGAISAITNGNIMIAAGLVVVAALNYATRGTRGSQIVASK